MWGRRPSARGFGGGSPPIDLLTKKDLFSIMELRLDESELVAMVDCEAGRVHVLDYLQPKEGPLWVRQVCGAPWCSRCEPIRAWRISKKIVDHLNYYSSMHWTFVTMSTRNEPTLKGAFESETAAWQRFRMGVANARRPTKKNRARSAGAAKHPWFAVETWVGCREVTYTKERGFNLHRHMFVGTAKPWLDWKGIHREWSAAARSAAHFDAKPITDRDGAVRYLAKYLAKVKYWGGLDRLVAFRRAEALRGRNRLIRQVGSAPPKAKRDTFVCCLSEHEGQCNRTGD